MDNLPAALLPPHQMAVDSPTEGNPPEKIFSDYVELVSLIVLFIVGAPLNLAAWTQIAEQKVNSRLDILKKHLNYSDLLVLFVYVPSRACWLLTYDWRGGDVLCRLVKFMHTFAFQISSNVIVCIALDRLLSVLSASHRNPDQAARRMRMMLLVAWLTAALISLPQFAVWRSFQAFDNPPWSQCMQIWEIQRATAHRDAGETESSVVSQLMHEENVYVVAHMLFIFWIPALIILLCYVLLSCWVYVNSKPSLFELTSTGKSDAVGNGRGGCEENQGVELRNREPRVSYQLATMTMNAETMDTTVAVSASAPKGKPMIVINDYLNHPLPTTPSPTPTSSAKEPKGNRSSSSASQETSLMLASAMRHRQSSSYSAKSNRNRAIRVSFLLVVGYFACWLPYNFLSLIQFVDPELFSRHANKVYFLHGMIVFNSVINPYLYGLCGGLCRQRRRDS